MTFNFRKEAGRSDHKNSVSLPAAVPPPGATGATRGAAAAAGTASPYHSPEYPKGGAVTSLTGGLARRAGAGTVLVGGSPPAGAWPPSRGTPAVPRVAWVHR